MVVCHQLTIYHTFAKTNTARFVTQKGSAMNVAMLINNSASPAARFVTWAYSPSSLRLTDATGAAAPVQVTVRNKPPANGGRVVFQAAGSTTRTASLPLILPLNGASVPFFISGDFGHPSTADGDCVIQVLVGTQVLLEVPIMVRIRKNANALNPAERNRFVAAFAALNNRGTGRFTDFRDMHTVVSQGQAHGAPGFLPWHRSYLLDLERELQAIDPSVALPYWRFDQPAPNLFTPDFMGSAGPNNEVQFSAANPLQFWMTDGVPGVVRGPLFNPLSEKANVISDAQTMGISDGFQLFASEMEGNPHGTAHTSFDGAIRSIGTAARDPLFFLLHANVDRLWAKWQRQYIRFVATQPDSFDNSSTFVGHRLNDTMWPWNQITGGTRPPTAPGGTLAPSTSVTAPGPQPFVRDMFDFQGGFTLAAQLGFDYDDVRFA
jgi:tyrosinase